MLDRVLTAVDGAGASDVVVVGPPRPVDRPATIFLQESVPGGGPVPAVAAGLSALPPADQVVLLLAVDLPLLEPSHLALLLAAVDVDGVEAAAAAGTRGRPNPLLAAYRREALLQQCGAGRTNLPAWTLLPPATVVVDLPEAALTNVNTPADLIRARHLANG